MNHAYTTPLPYPTEAAYQINHLQFISQVKQKEWFSNIPKEFESEQ
jgi:hypothetical protein